ncbi:hypothetical protein TEA_009511 [Camellia sinensis var. sinensis]|uniref:Uncharacterized protein n=1 Tax=Camellia sinensis var. sinensis TaxID=542762 RepID=A0A4S4D5X0_CAMSN|nr:hypothetical protein TEA_009511 [Camellia sinensis var. sinensis]
MTIHAFLLRSGLTISHLCSVRVVESIGENVDEVMEGDIVIPSFLADCGDCIDCKSKKSNLCSKFPFEVSPWMHRDKTSRFMDLKGETLYHFLYVSSFSEYTVVDVAHVTKIDPAIPPNRACLLSCGVSTGVGAAWRTADVEAGSTVAIFGLGAIGLAVAEGARMCGATRIIGVDVNPDKFETGKTFGVTDFVNSATCTDKRLSEGEVWPTIFRHQSAGASFAGDEEDEGEGQPRGTCSGFEGKNRKGTGVEGAGVSSRKVAEMEGRSRDNGLWEASVGWWGIVGQQLFWAQMIFMRRPECYESTAQVGFSKSWAILGSIERGYGSEARISDAVQPDLLVEEKRSMEEEEAQH